MLQSPRYRLLYYIHQKGSFELTEGTKKKLQGQLGYESEGALHYDWAILLKHELIKQDAKTVTITRKGRREFMLVDTFLLAGLISVLYGALFIVDYFVLRQYLLLNPWLAFLAPWLTGFVPWVITAFLNFYVYRLFRPKIPTRTLL